MDNSFFYTCGVGCAGLFGYLTYYVHTKIPLYNLFGFCKDYIQYKVNTSIDNTIIHNNFYDVSYTIHSTTYRKLIPIMKTPSYILSVMDHDNNDVTDQITIYLGPNQNDFKYITSKYFDYNSLTFNYIDKNNNITTDTFHYSDPIQLNI